MSAAAIKMLKHREFELLIDRRYAEITTSTAKDSFMDLWRKTNEQLALLGSPEILFGDIYQLYSQPGAIPTPEECVAYIRGMRGEI
jgi:hypothetical protein